MAATQSSGATFQDASVDRSDPNPPLYSSRSVAPVSVHKLSGSICTLSCSFISLLGRSFGFYRYGLSTFGYNYVMDRFGTRNGGGHGESRRCYTVSSGKPHSGLCTCLLVSPWASGRPAPAPPTSAPAAAATSAAATPVGAVRCHGPRRRVLGGDGAHAKRQLASAFRAPLILAKHAGLGLLRRRRRGGRRRLLTRGPGGCSGGSVSMFS